MVLGGVVEAFLGVKAEGQSLESIAQPLTAEGARDGGEGSGSGSGSGDHRTSAPSSA